MTDHASSVQGVALRVSKLDLAGKPLVGPKNSIVTDAFMRFGFTAEYTAGDEIEEKKADGSVCTYYQGDDVLKRVTFSLAICDPSPELHEMLIGGNILLPAIGSDPVGYAAPAAGVIANPNGVAFEVYSKAIVAGGRFASVNPYWRYVFPFAKMKLTGDRVLENGAMANEFEGYGLGNLNYGKGAAGTWPYPTDRPFQYARTAEAPVGINDYQAVVAPAAPVNEIQSVTFSTPGTAGTFTLSFSGQTTSPIAYNATAAEILTALAALPTIGGAGNVDVTGAAGGPFTVTFKGALAGVNVPALTADSTALTGGPVVVATTTQGS